MLVKQQWLLALLACFYSTVLIAEIDVNVEIRGIRPEMEQNVRLFLSIEQQKDHKLLSKARLHRLHAKASTEISKALQPFGHYRPEIKTELHYTQPKQWQAVYSIDPGPVIPISRWDFVVNEAIRLDPVFSKLIQNPGLEQDSGFNHIRYENLKSEMTRVAAENGYFDARFTAHRVEIDLQAYDARVRLHFDSGPRYRFGAISLDQQILNPKLLNRLIPFEVGNPYSLNKLIEFQQTLNDSDYFQTVEVFPGEIQKDTTEIPISVKLTPRKRHRYTVGLGYGSDTGARGKFGWSITPLNRAGHKFNTEASVSEIGFRSSLNYYVPVFNPRTDQMVYNAATVNEKTDTSDSTLYSVGVNLNRGKNKWRETIALNYQQEDYIVAADQGISSLLIPSLNWSRTWGKEAIITLDGLRFHFSMRGASDKLLSDNSFFQLQTGFKAINSLSDRNRIISRIKLGGTQTDAFHQLPPSIRFFAGGSQSVRGYKYQSLGPLDSNGEVNGGKHLMVGSVELEHKFDSEWSVAAFFDTGNAVNSSADKLARGSGLGLRWQSPVGPVRVDVASAVSREDRPWRVHINIGPDL